ncbi:MAG TPA: hypothetical protein VKZ60_19045 [Chloroflexota bacterium]|nr:hypothetical protein [Chloroflexota bacterium]
MRLRDKLGRGALGAGLGLAVLAGSALAQGGPTFPPGGPPPGGPPPGPPPSESDRGAMDAGMQAALALLGLTQEQLWAEGRNGRSLADLAAARGIDQSTLLNAMTSAAASWLAEQVSAGRLSQSDADTILQRAQQFTAQLIANPAPPAPMVVNGNPAPPPPPPGGPPPGPPPQGLPPR